MIAMSAGTASHVGLVRELNEDLLIAEVPVFLVADGMGGHDSGEVASAAAIDQFRALVGQSAVTVAAVSEAIAAANSAVIRHAGGLIDGGMGTTLTGLIIVENGGEPALLIANVGDSRVYRLRSEGFEQLSVDHSFVQELFDAGRIAASDVATHPQRNVVTRAIGIEAEVRPDLWLIEPFVGDRYLICSDGLHGEVPFVGIADALRSSQDPQVIADRLVSLALEAGGRDNVTVIVVDVVSIDVSHSFAATAPPLMVVTDVPLSGGASSAVAPEAPIVEVPLDRVQRGKPHFDRLIDEVPIAPVAHRNDDD